MQPQTRYRFAQRFGAAGVLLDQAKNQFPFTARVAGIDEFVDIFAFGQFDHGIQARFGFVYGLQFEMRGNNRQVGKTPLATLYVVLLRGLNFHQMADGAGHHVVVILKIFVVFFELSA